MELADLGPAEVRDAAVLEPDCEALADAGQYHWIQWLTIDGQMYTHLTRTHLHLQG